MRRVEALKNTQEYARTLTSVNVEVQLRENAINELQEQFNLEVTPGNLCLRGADYVAVDDVLKLVNDVLEHLGYK